MKELVEKIVRALVDFPEEIDVRGIEGATTNILEIKVSKRDVGKLIGKQGKNIDALRTIVVAAGKGKRYMVELAEGNHYHRSNRHHQHDRNLSPDRASHGEGNHYRE
jgi:predicted RNA-binding protein YlqC (UPF0109 family)